MDNISASGNPVGIVENSHTSGQTVGADFRGRITDQQGASIAGASVSAGGSVTFTNAQGFYQLEDAAVDDNYALIKVEYKACLISIGHLSLGRVKPTTSISP